MWERAIYPEGSAHPPHLLPMVWRTPGDAAGCLLTSSLAAAILSIKEERGRPDLVMTPTR